MSTSWTTMGCAGLASFFVVFQHWHLKCDPPATRGGRVLFAYSWLCSFLLIGVLCYLGYALKASAVLWTCLASTAVTSIGFFLFEGPLGRSLFGKLSFFAAPMFTYFLFHSIAN